MISISVLIVCYKSRNLILDCLDGLIKHTSAVNYEVLVIDNSNDGSVDLVRKFYPKVRIIKSKGNIGFGPANNYLAKHAIGKYLLLLNPDTVIKDDTVGALFGFAKKRQDAGVWGGVPRLPDGSVDPGCLQATPSLSKVIKDFIGLTWLTGKQKSKALQGIAEVSSVSGAFMMVQRELWDKMGGMDESFYMYCEETDFCYRVRRRGLKVLRTPEAQLVHLVGSGSAKDPHRLVSILKGQAHFVHKTYGCMVSYLIILLMWGYVTQRFLSGVILPLAIGRMRANELKHMYRLSSLRPGLWWRGYLDQHTDHLCD